MKSFKSLLAAASALTMVASIGAISVSAEDTEVTGIVGNSITATTTVDSPIINVVVPSTFTFALNNYEIGGKSQIYSDDFKIVNKSNVPVNVGVTVATTVKSASLVDDASKVLNNGTANAFLQLDYASKWTRDGDDATTMATEDDDPVFGVTYEDTPVSKTLGATNNFDFLLGPATYDSSTPPVLTELNDTVPAAAFKLSGTLDESFTWTTANISMKVSYKITSMKGSTYTARASEASTENAQGLVQPTLMGADNTKLSSITVDEGNTLVSSIIGTGAATVKSIGTYSISTKKTTALSATGNYTLASGTNTITWLKTQEIGDGLVFTMSDGSIYYFTASGLSTIAPTA